MNDSLFAVVPMEVVLDRRLTLEQTRVLIALFSFRNKVTNTVWPSRASIAERTGMHPSNISAATTSLVNLGWLIKEGTGGHSKATRYTLNVPDIEQPQKVAHSATVAEQATVAQSATQTVAESATQTVAHSATRKEQSNEQSIEQSKVNTARTKSSPPAKPEGVSDQTWADWLQLRKEKRAAVTQTAVDGIAREAAKAGYTLEQALQTCCSNGWQGFKADWVQPRNQPGQPQQLPNRPPQETAYQRQMRERVAVLTPRLAATPPQQSAAGFFASQAIDVQARDMGQTPCLIGGE